MEHMVDKELAGGCTERVVVNVLMSKWKIMRGGVP